MSFRFGEAMVGRTVLGSRVLDILVNGSIDGPLHAFQVMGPTVPIADIPKVRNILSKGQVYGVVHGDYTYNFCRKMVGHQVDKAIGELNFASQLGCDLILHQGKNVPNEQQTKTEAINQYIEHIKEILDSTFELSNSIILENSAHQGTELGYSLA